MEDLTWRAKELSHKYNNISIDKLGMVIINNREFSELVSSIGDGELQRKTNERNRLILLIFECYRNNCDNFIKI
jgi:hypothetical protein